MHEEIWWGQWSPSRPCSFWRPPRVPRASNSRPRPDPNRRPRRPRRPCRRPRRPPARPSPVTSRYEAEDGDEVPAEGVELTIESADGAFTQTVETDAEGHFEVPVPGPGAYTVTIDDELAARRCRAAQRRPHHARRGVAGRPGPQRPVPDRLRRGADPRRLVDGRPGGAADRPGHPLRPHHRDVRHRPVADLRHDRPDELLPRRAGHVRRAGRLPVQRDDRVAHVHRRPARHRGGRAVRASASTLASGGRCATGARA